MLYLSSFTSFCISTCFFFFFLRSLFTCSHEITQLFSPVAHWKGVTAPTEQLDGNQMSRETSVFFKMYGYVRVMFWEE